MSEHKAFIERVVQQVFYAVLDAQFREDDPHGPAYVALERELLPVLEAGEAMRRNGGESPDPSWHPLFENWDAAVKGKP